MIFLRKTDTKLFEANLTSIKKRIFIDTMNHTMEKKKISIVLPVYNGAAYLAESIESILSQTYTNWELIIVNDCSTDNSLSIALEYAAKDARIKVLSNNENLKLPNSLNVGFNLASGSYYTWTSDDNKYKPNALQTMIVHLERNPAAVMVYANYTCIDSSGNVIDQTKKPEPKYIFAENVVGACFLYTAEAAKRIGKYDADMFLAEDYDFWIRLCKVGKLLHIEEDLYYYRRHKNSLSETKKAYVNEQTYKVLEKNFLFAYTTSKKNKHYKEFFDHILNRASAHYVETLWMLLSINKKYLFHLNLSQFKILVWNSYLWQTLRKISRRM